jgi:bifunctional non-homologous end joining protein LigD
VVNRLRPAFFRLYALMRKRPLGDELRSLPLHLRKANLEQLLARRPDGIIVAPFERGEIGPDLFRAACRMGLEGLVSKHRNRPYRGGRQKFWIKVKNRCHPARWGASYDSRPKPPLVD